MARVDVWWRDRKTLLKAHQQQQLKNFLVYAADHLTATQIRDGTFVTINLTC